jgi:hypothetical protein
VRVKVGPSVQTRMVRTGSSYLSQSELPLTFGLGSAPAADEVIVEWPSGTKQRLTGLRAGRSYVVTEGTGITQAVALGSAAR